mmetsp:Transcript_28748/g.65764  ORF Transcript_28748/g.65764 Transcript_28748/m.65764 type:complete len:230 (-) Transcript_28748:10800-11489(-)
MRGVAASTSERDTSFNIFRPRPCQGKWAPRDSSICIVMSSTVSPSSNELPWTTFNRRIANTILSSVSNPRATREMHSRNSAFLKCSTLEPSSLLCSEEVLRTHFNTFIKNFGLSWYKKWMFFISSNKTNIFLHTSERVWYVEIAFSTSAITAELLAICSSTIVPSFISTSIPSTTLSSSRILPCTPLSWVNSFSSNWRSATFCSPWSFKMLIRFSSTSGFSLVKIMLIL